MYMYQLRRPRVLQQIWVRQRFLSLSLSSRGRARRRDDFPVSAHKHRLDSSTRFKGGCVVADRQLLTHTALADPISLLLLLSLIYHTLSHSSLTYKDVRIHQPPSPHQLAL